MKVPQIDIQRQLNRQIHLWGVRQRTRNRSMGPRRFITVSREFGCDGYALALELVRRLDGEEGRWQVYGKEILEQIAGDLHVSRLFLESFENQQRNELQSYLETTFQVHPEELTVFHRIVRTIRGLALQGNVIIVGRGAGFCTSDLQGGVRVRITAPRSWRLQRIRELGLAGGMEEAERLLEEKDSARRRYIRERFGRDVQDPLHYHLVLNNGLLDLETMAESVLTILKKVNASVNEKRGAGGPGPGPQV